MVAGQRLVWPDVAKGISILGVITLHVSLDVPGGEESLLAAFNHWLDPMRMPLFFLVSGFFSAKVLKFSFTQLLTKRLWFFVVPYIIWVSVQLWLKRWEWFWLWDTQPLTWEELYKQLILGHNMGWFLHALVVFNLILWTLRSLQGWMVLVLSFMPFTLLAWNEEYYIIGKAALYLPIFMAGVFMRMHIARFAQAVVERRGWAFAMAAVMYAVGFSLGSWWAKFEKELQVAWPFGHLEYVGNGEISIFIRLFEQLLELPFAIMGVVLISQIPALSRALAGIGRNTLPMYLAHPIGLTLGFQFLRIFTGLEISLGGPWPLGNTWFWMGYCFAVSFLFAFALWGIGKVPVLSWTLTPPPLSLGDGRFSAVPRQRLGQRRD
ncbi:MAG: acyltransferase family protein [Corynebacterium sp.]|nr:acyltransferase family protein [Corynebacterium sp.]